MWVYGSIQGRRKCVFTGKAGGGGELVKKFVQNYDNMLNKLYELVAEGNLKIDEMCDELIQYHVSFLNFVIALFVVKSKS